MKRYYVGAAVAAVFSCIMWTVTTASATVPAKAAAECSCGECKCPDCNGETCTCNDCQCTDCGCNK